MTLVEMERFPFKRISLYTAGYISANLAWAVYSIYVPLFARRNLIKIVGDNSSIINTLVGIIMILDNIAALFIQPYIGELSDRTWLPKLGRRMPFILLGLPLAAFFFGLIGTLNSTLYLLLITIIGFNVSMAFYKTPVMSLIPDALPQKYRSQGSSLLNIFGGIANLIALLSSSFIYKYYSARETFWFISLLMIVCLLILIFSVKEKKQFEVEEDREDKVKIFQSLKNMFKTDKKIRLMLFAIFFVNAGYHAGETYLSSYVTVLLGFSDYTAGLMLGYFMAFVILSAIPAGLVGRKISPINASIIGLVGFILGIIPLTTASFFSLESMRKVLTLNSLQVTFETFVYIMMIAVMGFCYILVSINLIVVIWDYAPENRIATYTGYFYVFTSLSAILSPFIAGVIFDIVSVFSGKTGLKWLFVYVTSAFAIGLIFVSRVKDIEVKELNVEPEERLRILKQRELKRKATELVPSILYGFVIKRRASSKLRKLQKKERQELKNDLKDDDIDKKEKKSIRERLRKLRKIHRKERKRFRNEEFE